MLKAARLLFVLFLFACSVVLYLSIWPGELYHSLIKGFLYCLIPLHFIIAYWYVTLPIILVAVAFALKESADHFDLEPKSVFSKRGMVVFTCLSMLTLSLVVYDVPLKLAFAFSRPSFDITLAKEKVKGAIQSRKNKTFGLYEVSNYSIDKDGTAYFITGSGLGGAYGFVNQPNKNAKSKFNKLECSLRHIEDDWYWFNLYKK